MHERHIWTGSLSRFPSHFQSTRKAAIFKAQFFNFASGSPHLHSVIIRSGNEHLGISRIEGHRVDDVNVREFGKTHSVVTVPQVAMFVFCSAKYNFNEVLQILWSPDSSACLSSCKVPSKVWPVWSKADFNFKVHLTYIHYAM